MEDESSSVQEKERSKKSRDGAEDEDDGLGMPDPDLPLHKQLEEAFQTIKKYSQVLAKQVGKANSLFVLVMLHAANPLQRDKVIEIRKTTDETQRRLREAEAAGTAKDRIISDLRMQVRI